MIHNMDIDTTVVFAQVNIFEYSKLRLRSILEDLSIPFFFFFTLAIPIQSQELRELSHALFHLIGARELLREDTDQRP